MAASKKNVKVVTVKARAAEAGKRSASAFKAAATSDTAKAFGHATAIGAGAAIGFGLGTMLYNAVAN